LGLTAAAVAVVVAVLALLAAPRLRERLWRDERPPLVLVLPFTAETTGEEAKAEAAGYTSELIGALARFPELRVAGVETAFAAAKASETDPEFARRFGADYVLSGAFDPRADLLVVQAILTRAEDGRVLWSERMTGSRTPDMAHGAGRRIVQEIAQRLGQPYGVIQAEEAAHHLGPQETWSSYSCLLRTFEYWRSYDARLHLQARNCIEAAVRNDPGARDALWALAYLRLDEHRLGYNVRPGADPLTEAEALARRATQLQPSNPRAFQALAAVRYVAGDKEGFRRAADEALRLGPHDPDILADIGASEIGIGEFETGNARLDEALRMNPVPPVWIVAWRAAGALGAGAHEEALSFARRIDADGYVLGGLIQLAVADMQKDEKLARSAYATLSRTAPEVLADPAPFLRRQGPVGEAADRLASLVLEAAARQRAAE
jgi:TolB-like protein